MRHFVRLRGEEEETDGLHYARQREAAARRCAVQASRTPAECFCRPRSDFQHRYREQILFFQPFLRHGSRLLVVGVVFAKNCE